MYTVHKSAGWAAIVNMDAQAAVILKTRDHALADTAAWMANHSEDGPEECFDLAEQIFYDNP